MFIVDFTIVILSLDEMLYPKCTAKDEMLTYCPLTSSCCCSLDYADKPDCLINETTSSPIAPPSWWILDLGVLFIWQFVISVIIIAFSKKRRKPKISDFIYAGECLDYLTHTLQSLDSWIQGG